MTRGAIKTRLQQVLAELYGTPQNDAIFTLDDDVTNAASELAESCYCYYGRESADIINGQAEYCGAPSIFRVTAVTATWADGSTQILQPLHGQGIDDIQASSLNNWRTAPLSGNPYFYMQEGLNRIKIYPVPNYTSLLYSYTDLVIQAATNQVASVARPFVATDAVASPNPPYVLNISGGAGFNTGQYKILSVAAGIATLDRSIGTAASTGGVGTLSQGGLTVEGYSTLPGSVWAADTAECPLPTTAHDAVMLGAALQRCIEFPAENGPRMALIQRRYSELRGKLVRRAHTLSRSNSYHSGR